MSLHWALLKKHVQGLLKAHVLALGTFKGILTGPRSEPCALLNVFEGLSKGPRHRSWPWALFNRLRRPSKEAQSLVLDTFQTNYGGLLKRTMPLPREHLEIFYS